MAESLMKYFEPKREIVPTIIWIWGESGSGKTRWVYENYTEVFRPVSHKWWEGYDGHKTVLIDDIRADWCTWREILTLLDVYPLKVECKGGSRQLLAETIILTCDRPPEGVWCNSEDVNQLHRRISEIRELHRITQKSGGNTSP